MTHRDKLVKLAVIAGWTIIDLPFADGKIYVEKNGYKKHWNPYENREQAFECLENSTEYSYDVYRRNILTSKAFIFACEVNHICAHGDTVQEAICNAVLKAVES